MMFARRYMLCWTVVMAIASSTSAVEQQEGVRGVVIAGEDDQPVEEATVYLLGRSKGSYTLPTHPMRTTTAANGSFHFEDVPNGSYLIWSEKGPKTSLEKKLGGHRFQIGKDAVAEPLTLKLREGCRFHVAVTSKDTGQPLPGAKITFGWTDIEREFVADKDGVIRIVGLAPDSWFLKIVAPGHAMQFERTKEVALGSLTKLSIELALGGEIAGILTDDENQPIPDARVSVVDDDYGAMQTYGRVRTDERGRFRIQHVPRATTLRVSTRPEGHLRVRKKVVIGTDQEFATFKLVAPRRPYGGDIIAKVVDGDGKPIPGATVTNQGNSTALERKAKTDAQGKATLSDLYESLDGKSIVVKADGYVPQRVAVEVGTREKPSVVEVTLERGAIIKGRVLLPSGEPAKQVRVYYAEGEHGELEGGRVVTNDEGRFMATGLPPGCTFTIYAPKGCAPFDDRTLPLDQDEEVVVQLDPEGVVRAQAIDGDTGMRIASYNVKIGFSQTRKQGEPSRGLPTQWIREGFDIEPKDNEFRLGGLPPGMPLQLTVTAEGYEPSVIPRVVAAEEGKSEMELVKLSVVDPSKYRRVAGVVKRADGIPVGGVHLRLLVGKSIPAGGGGVRGDWGSLYNWTMLESGEISRHAECLQFLTTTSDSEGNFEFTEVRPGEWMEVYCTGNEIAATRLGGIQDRTDQELGNVELRVPQPASLEVHVDRTAWPKAHRVQLSSRSHFALDATFGYASKSLKGGSEQVTFENLPSGEYQLTIETAFERLPGGRLKNDTLHRDTVNLKAGEAAVRKF